MTPAGCVMVEELSAPPVLRFEIASVAWLRQSLHLKQESQGGFRVAWKVAGQQLQHWGQLAQATGDPARTVQPQIPAFPYMGCHQPTKLSKPLLSPHCFSNGSQGFSDQSSEHPVHWLCNHGHFPESVSSLMGWDGMGPFLAP